MAFYITIPSFSENLGIKYGSGDYKQVLEKGVKRGFF